MLDFKFEDFIHISSSEGSFANYHNFYYNGQYLTIEDYLFEENINYYLQRIVDDRKITDKGLTASSEERELFKKFINQFTIPSGKLSEHPITRFLAIDKRIKRKLKIKKLLENEIS
jgi:hypothetical protein